MDKEIMKDDLLEAYHKISDRFDDFTLMMRKQFPLNKLFDPSKDTTRLFPKEMISRIEDIGRAQEKLKTILDDDIFDMTSKHNIYWKSEHSIESEKLDDLRRKFVGLSDDLYDLLHILRNEEE